MKFSAALTLIETGNKVFRTSWNGKDMFVFLVPGSQFKVNRPPLLGIYPEGTDITYNGHIDIRTATGKISPWTPSQEDMLSDDWEIFL